MARWQAVGWMLLASGWMTPPALAATAGRSLPVCVTVGTSGPFGSGPAFVVPEQRRPIAGGRVLLVVRGQVAPDALALVATVVEDSYRLLRAELGLPGFADRIVVDLTDDSGSAETRLSNDGGTAEIRLPRGLEAEAMRRALAHQLGHLPGLAWQREAEPWLSEATARWLGGRLLPQTASEDLGLRLRSAGDSGAAGGDGGATWLRFLELRHGAGVIGSIWELVGSQPDLAAARATEQVLAEQGSSLRAEAEAYATWLLAETRRLEAIPTGDLMVAPVAAPLRYPARGAAVVPGAQPFGVTFLRLPLASVAGGLRVEIRGSLRGEWSAVLALVPLDPERPVVRVSLPRTAPGRVGLTVPAEDGVDAWVAVVGGGPAGGLTPFAWEALVEESFPFVLDHLDAVSDAGRVRLSWETRSETSVVGWTLWRRGETDAAFSVQNPVLVPGSAAFGLSGGSGYSVVDDQVERGRRYSYYLEAVTADGLRAPSQVISLRVR